LFSFLWLANASGAETNPNLIPNANPEAQIEHSTAPTKESTWRNAPTEAGETLSRKSNESASLRGETRFLISGAVSPIDLIIPMKYGATATWMIDADSALELDYLRSSWKFPFFVEDLGEISDQRIALLYRKFTPGSNFNLSVGLTYFRFKAHLGPEFLSGSVPATGVDFIDQQTLGIQGSLGHRWYLAKNFALGVDWISLAQPLVQLEEKSAILHSTTNAAARETIEDTLKVMRYLPRFVFFKVQLSFAF
jgi:hypothetical protein